MSNHADPRLVAYLDFDIEIGPGQGRDYPVSVVQSPAGEARELLRFPFDSLALDNRLQALEIALLRSGGQHRRLLRPQEQTVQEFGQALFDALLVGDVRTRYDMSRREAAVQGRGLRLKLRIQSPELATLPWEFLYDPRQGEYLCLSAHTPIVRYAVMPQSLQPLTVTPPLRILLMIANPRSLPPLDVARERQRVEAAVAALQARQMIQLTVMEGQTWRDLQRTLRSGPWHIFHFVGHGGFDEGADEGLIALADEQGQPQFLTATLLGRLLADHAALRLVLLNSCDGARSSQRNVFSSTAALLVRRGIPAVVAMQYEITDAAAIEFSRAFYEAIADGWPVDAAVPEARKAISMAVANSLEWGTPVLYLRAPHGAIFDVPLGAAQSRDTQPDSATKQSPSAAPLSDTGLKRLDASYTEALSAFYTGNWERAAVLLSAIVAKQPHYEDAADKLHEARQQQQLAQHRAAAAQAMEARAWTEAVAQLQALQTLEPQNQAVAEQLAAAQQQARLAELYAEAVRLHGAQSWQAVVNVFAHIHAVDPAYPDQRDLEGSAREALARQQQRAAAADHQPLAADQINIAVDHQTAALASSTGQRAAIRRSTHVWLSLALAAGGWIGAWNLLALVLIAGDENIDAPLFALGGALCFALGGLVTGIALHVIAPGSLRRRSGLWALSWGIAWLLGYQLGQLSQQSIGARLGIVGLMGGFGTLLVLWRQPISDRRWPLVATSLGWAMALGFAGWLGGSLWLQLADQSMSPENAALLSFTVSGMAAGVLAALR